MPNFSFEDLLEFVDDPAVVLDETLCVVAANAAFVLTFDLSPEGIISQSIDKLDDAWGLFRIRRLLEAMSPEQGKIGSVELSDHSNSGTWPRLLASAQYLPGGQESSPAILVRLEVPAADDRALARYALVAGLLYRATTLATAAESEEQALEACVTAVLERTGWHSGHVWSGRQGDRLARIGSWFNRGISLETGDLLQDKPLPAGAGTIGRACETGAVAWVNIQDEPDDPRRRMYQQLGIKTVLAVPIPHTGSAVRLVFEFLHTERQSRSEDVVVFCRLIAEVLSRVMEREEVAERLSQAKDDAEAASRAKGDFLAKMSHELRTPMNVILGMIQLALQKELPADVTDYLETAKQSSHELLSGLNDLLDVSSLDQEADAIELEPVDLEQLIQALAKRLQVRFADKGLRLVTDVAEAVPAQVLTDGMRLQEVLDKLLDNSLKFTDEGEIVMRVMAEPDASSDVVLRFEITDTGIGMAPEAIPDVLKPFTQVGSSANDEVAGTGLGLAVCQKLLAELGTTLSITSEQGSGTSIRFDLRAVTVKPPATAIGRTPGSAGRASSLSILLAEDMPANRKLVTSILREHAHQVAVAINGREAIDCVLGGDFDLVLMDVRMPVMDGYEATKAIRQSERLSGRHVPIVAMTAHASHRDREACRQAGMDAYVSKPIDIDELLAVIDRFAGKPATPDAAVPAPTIPPDSDHQSAINFADAMKRLYGDRELFREFVEVFDEDAPPLLQAMSDALQASDGTQLGRAAHSLRGLAVNLGADSVQRLASELEEHGKSNNLLSARHTFDALRDAFELLQKSLAEFRERS